MLFQETKFIGLFPGLAQINPVVDFIISWFLNIFFSPYTLSNLLSLNYREDEFVMKTLGFLRLEGQTEISGSLEDMNRGTNTLGSSKWYPGMGTSSTVPSALLSGLAMLPYHLLTLVLSVNRTISIQGYKNYFIVEKLIKLLQNNPDSCNCVSDIGTIIMKSSIKFLCLYFLPMQCNYLKPTLFWVQGIISICLVLLTH